MTFQFKSAARALRFGFIGLLAALAQTGTFLLLSKYGDLGGAASNVVAWVLSVIVSYLGQSRWTFADRGQRSFSRFLMIAIMTFSVSTSAAWLIVDYGRLDPFWMLPIILIAIPALSYALMSSWAFR